MNLGWIDFSERDRRKAINIIHLLQEEGAIDELGIGLIRDGFANLFFPGSSTIQTRAKYFFIVPYAIKTCCENPRYRNVPEVRRALDDMEKSCALMMMSLSDHDGVIGSNVLPKKWVVRRPSSIYWNGIRTLGLLTNKYMSIDECIKESIARRGKERISNWMEDGEEYEQDDRDAGRDALRPLWNLPHFPTNWMVNLNVSLTAEETKALRDSISGMGGSLYKYILDNNLKLGTFVSSKVAFRALYSLVKNDVPAALGNAMQMAVWADTLIYMCRILFNRCLSEDQNKEAMKEWAVWHSDQHLSEISCLNIDDVFTLLRLPHRRVKSFLIDMQRLILAEDIESAKRRLQDWEVELKGEKRSKLLRRNEFKNDVWIGGEHLDYRLLSAARIIKDIYATEGRPYV